MLQLIIVGFVLRVLLLSTTMKEDQSTSGKVQTMNPFNAASQEARTFSTYLGNLAAQAANRPEASPQLGTVSLPERLAAIVGRLQQGQQKRRQMHKELLMEELAAP